MPVCVCLCGACSCVRDKIIARLSFWNHNKVSFSEMRRALGLGRRTFFEATKARSDRIAFSMHFIGFRISPQSHSRKRDFLWFFSWFFLLFFAAGHFSLKVRPFTWWWLVVCASVFIFYAFLPEIVCQKPNDKGIHFRETQWKLWKPFMGRVSVEVRSNFHVLLPLLRFRFGWSQGGTQWTLPLADATSFHRKRITDAKGTSQNVFAFKLAASLSAAHLINVHTHTHTAHVWRTCDMRLWTSSWSRNHISKPRFGKWII